jgi:hypothetical protein
VGGSRFCGREESDVPTPSYLSEPRERPRVSDDLISLVWALAYGAAMGALIASALWWWLG